MFAASEARAAGRGGATAVSQATGIARSTIGRGLADLHVGAQQFGARIRRVGGGGKPAIETQPALLAALNDLVQSSIRGDPEAALLWVSKSQRHLAAALAEKGFTAGQKLVGRLLRRLGFSLQSLPLRRRGPTARRAKGPATRTATLSSSISTPRWRRSRLPASRQSRSTRRRRSLSATSRMAGVSFARKASPSRSGCTTSPSPNSARRCPPPSQEQALRRLRHRRQRRLGQPRHHSRHRGLRRREHPALVARAWSRPLSERRTAADHRRLRRQQRRSCAPLET